MTKRRHTSTGRVTVDDRGNSVWEWRVQNGFAKDVDTASVKALSETSVLRVLDAAAEAEKAGKPQRADYFVVAGPKDDPAAGRRRSLDDMRKLSEEIKRQRKKNTG